MKDADGTVSTLDSSPIAAPAGSAAPAVATTVDVAFSYEEERQKEFRKYRGLLAIILLWVSLAVGLMVIININVRPSGLVVWTHPEYASRHGYTWSLLIVLLPSAFLTRWYLKNRDALALQPLMRALLWKAAYTSTAWVILDVVLARLFFTFPDERARAFYSIYGYRWDGPCSTIWTIWNLFGCYDWGVVPLEEVIFYVASAFLLTFMYMWATEDFFRTNAIPREKYETLAQSSGPLVNWNKPILAWGIGLAVAGVLLKNFGPQLGLSNETEGWFPSYLVAQLALVFVPLAAFYNRVHTFTNPQAFLYVMQLQLLISLIWESTLAVPYGWWNYQETAMMGITVTAWSELHIEAIILWLAVGWSSMFLYETSKIKVLSGKEKWSQVLLGRDKWFA